MTRRVADELYHDLMSSPETLAIRAEVRAFADEHVAPVAHELAQAIESVEAFPHDLFAKMADAGLFTIPFAAEIGGRGLERPATATCVTVEELAYYSNSVAAIYDVHCILAGQALARGDEQIRGRFLPQITAGEVVASFATSEPESSTDLAPSRLKTRIEEHDGDLFVSGRKRWITNSPIAAFVVVLCGDGERATLAVVDLKAPGVTIGRPDRKLGNRVQLTADITFDRVRVSPLDLIGTRGDGLRIALQTLTYGRIGIAAAGVGMAQRAFDEATARLTERHVFGQPLGGFQHWQFKMAERATELENARNLYLKAAIRHDSGIPFPEPEAAMAKHYGTALAVDLARDAIQIFGGYGFVSELSGELHGDGRTFPLEAIYRDAKIGEIYEGANEIQKWVIARQIFGRDITG